MRLPAPPGKVPRGLHHLTPSVDGRLDPGEGIGFSRGGIGACGGTVGRRAAARMRLVWVGQDLEQSVAEHPPGDAAVMGKREDQGTS